MQHLETIKNHLSDLGIHNVHSVIHNPDYTTLFTDETAPHTDSRENTRLTSNGAVAVDTCIFTGRSPSDKYFVCDKTTEHTLWWNDGGQNKNDNKPITQEIWAHLKSLSTTQLSGKKLYVVDARCGASAHSRLAVRFITEVAWQAHFVTNMFIRPSTDELFTFSPDFVVINSAKAVNPNWQEQGLNSENYVAFNLTENVQLIGGSWHWNINMTEKSRRYRLSALFSRALGMIKAPTCGPRLISCRRT